MASDARASKAAGTMMPAADSTSIDDYRRFVERQLRKTRGQLQWTEIATVLATFAAAGLAYLLLFTILDQWMITGGAGRTLRLVFFLVFAAASAYYCARALLPLVSRRINLLYAAQTIEHGEPGLKNGLLNFLLLGARRREVNPAVYEAIGRRAANDLAQVPPEKTLDRSQLIQVGYVLMAVVAVVCIYTLLSPKNPLRSVGRMVMPWADIEAATRVRITDVTPGSRQAFHDEIVEVSALVLGLRDDEPVSLIYSTADGQTVDMPIAMETVDGSFRHRAALPAGSKGLQQDVTYRIVAGDAHTRRFSIHVVTAPAIIVDRADYVYPAYTGLSPRSTVGQGDLVAIEGTRVTLHARANDEIVEAAVDLDCDGRRDVAMKPTGREATAELALEIEEETGEPGFTTYQLRFKNEAGIENPRPPRHRVEIVADASPQIELLEPAENDLEVPVNAAIQIRVRAEDPDFALSMVTMHATRDGEEIARQALLEQRHEGEFDVTLQLAPRQLGLRPGDEITYWATAQDNKEPQPNVAETLRYRLRVLPPEEQQQDDQGQQREPGAGEENATEGEPQPGEGEQRGDGSEDGAEGEEGDDEAQADEPGAEPQDQQDGSGEEERAERVDPETQPGEAFEEMVKHFQERGELPPDPPEDAAERQQPDPQDAEQQNDTPQDQQPGEASEQQQQQPGAAPSGEGDQPMPPSEPGASPAGQQNEDAGDQQGAQQQGDQATEPGEQGAGAEGRQQPGGDQSADQRQDGAAGESEPAGSRQQPQGPQDGPSNARDQQTSGQQAGGRGQDQPQESTGEAGGARNDPQPAGPDQGESGSAAENQDPGAQNDGAAETSQRQDSQDSSGETSGDAGQSAGTGEEPGEQQQPGGSQGAQEGGGDPDKQKGPPGAGRQTREDAGSGSPQESAQSRDKQQNPSPSNGEEEASDPASPASSSRKESDSEGNESGDKSGGGAQGPGQQADQEGSGGAGSNTAADEGAGMSEGAGTGPASDQSGDKTPSGSASDPDAPKAQGQGGEGESQPASGGSSPGQQSPDSSAGADGQNAPSGAEAPGASSGTEGTGGAPGAPQTAQGEGGGQPSETPAADDAGRDAAPGDDPVLDYSRRATDLVLERLRDQMTEGEVDQELLDRLQWTEGDMERFVGIWEEMKRQAQLPGEEGQQARDELEQALRGLGLRPQGAQIEAGNTADDALRRLREAQRTTPPPEYAEQFREFTEGVRRRSADN